jgi:3-dehydroquinate dehydratase/shikimate dehydrogenase
MKKIVSSTICVSIARGRHRHVIAEHRYLAEQGVSLVELRLDAIQGPVQVHRLLAERPCPAIVTCRRHADGGFWQHGEDARRMVLRTAIAAGVEYVDLEDDIAGIIPRYGRTKRIVSHHDFRRTPTDLAGLHARLAALDADIVKLATLATHPNDNLRMLELVHATNVPTVGICMGDIGTPSRVLAGRFGAPFTFAPFHEERILAPGQIGWQKMRDLYRYESITPATVIYGVIADPVGHSLSPVVHNAAFAAEGLDAVYLPFRVPAGHLQEFLAAAGRWPLAGISVTIPHKEAILPSVGAHDDLVVEIGAANTIHFKVAAAGEEPAEMAFNTDATAAIEGLRDVVSEREDGAVFGGRAGMRTALILGAGGAARAIAFGLKRQGVEVTISSRTADRAKQLAADVGGKAVEWPARHRLPADCVINATPIGMHPDVDATPFEAAYLRPYMVVFDTVYNPENTLLIKEARAVGCQTVTGVEMFVRQAAAQFRIWQGHNPPEGVMREALKRATSSVRIDT